MKATARRGDRIRNGATKKTAAWTVRSPASARAARSRRRAREMALATCRLSASRNSRGSSRTAWIWAQDRPNRPLSAGLVGHVDEGPRHQVGVLLGPVGVGVVPVVLGLPPAEAEPGQQVGHEQPDQVVVASLGEDLVVSGIVADEAELGEHEGQAHGHDQVPPAVAHQDGRDPEEDQRGEQGGDLHRVVGPTTAQQPLVAHLPGELGEVLAVGGRRRGLGVAVGGRRRGPCELGDHGRLSVAAN